MARRFKSQRSNRKPLNMSLQVSSFVRIRGYLLPVIIVLAVLTFALFLIDQRLRPAVTTASKALATKAATESLNTALTMTISDYADDNHLVTTTESAGSHAELTLTHVNMGAMARLQGIATAHAEGQLESLSKQMIRLPVVQMFSGSLWSRSTLTVPVRIKMLGSVHSEIESDVQSQGVNQVVHIIYLHLTADVMVISPFVTTPTQISARAPVAYIVMSGPVPDVSTGLVHENRNLK